MTDFEERRDFIDQPVLLDLAGVGAGNSSPWTPANLVRRAGSECAPVAVSRNRLFAYSPEARGEDPGHLFQFETHSLGSALDEMSQPNHERYLYLMQVRFPPYLPGLSEIAPPLPFEDPDQVSRTLWIGPDQSTTPLHFDRYRSLIIQFYGRKRITLFPPGEIGRLEQFPLNCSTPHVTKINVDALTPEQEERLAPARRFDFHLEGGEALLLPPYWYHQVCNEGLSVSVHHWWTCPISGELPENLAALSMHEFRRCRLRRLRRAACTPERPRLLDLAPIFLERADPHTSLLITAAHMELVIRGRATRSQLPWTEAASFADLNRALEGQGLLSAADASWLDELAECARLVDAGTILACTPRDVERHLSRASQFCSQ